MPPKSSAILCMLSGGVSSTGVLHLLLTDDRYKDFEIVIHHVNIHNREFRVQAEAQAVKNIISFYQSRGHSFLFTDSIFDTLGFAPLNSQRYPQAMDVCAFMAAHVALAKQNLSNVAVGGNRTKRQKGGDELRKKVQKAMSVYQSALLHTKIPFPPYVFPTANYALQEIWQGLPQSVRQHTWWCHAPVYDDPENVPTACGECDRCTDMEEVLELDV